MTAQERYIQIKSASSNLTNIPSKTGIPGFWFLKKMEETEAACSRNNIGLLSANNFPGKERSSLTLCLVNQIGE
jgi:hypothetical protein